MGTVPVMPYVSEPPSRPGDLTRAVSVLEDGVAAARRRLDEIASQVAALRPGVPVPDELSSLLSEARGSLEDVEIRRDAARERLKPRDRTRPGIG